VLAVLFCA
jgi:hypothetical protein